MKSVGITSYGAYVPSYRVRLAEIATVWRKDPNEIIGSLGLEEKSVPAIDEDAVTLALESALQSFSTVNANPSDLSVLFVGSESHPYAVNPTSTIVGELLGVGNAYLAADLQFACKAATSGIQAIAGLLGTGQISYGMSIGADTAQSRPHDALEYTSAAAGVALLLGTKDIAVELVNFASYSSDTPDFWRRDGIRYPSHAGRFTGEPAYFTHVMGATEMLLQKTHLKPTDFDFCVFHMPNGRFPRDVAKRLGFTPGQLAPSLTIDKIGNPYSASAMMGLVAVLDIAKPGQKICMTSYGSGAGSDSFVWSVTDKIIELQKKRKALGVRVEDQLAHTKEISYVQYLKQTGKI